MSVLHGPAAHIARLAVLAPACCLLLTSCAPDGGHLGLVASGHFSAQQHFPTVLLSWCGDSPPTQIDLVADSHQWRLTATREFPGTELEVDLAAPGEDWEITDGEGAQMYRVVPESPETEYTLGVATEPTDSGEEPVHDVASVEFTTSLMEEEHGIYLSDDGETEVVTPEEFPPDC